MATIYFEDEGDLDLGLEYLKIADRVVEAVLDMEKCPYEAQVELNLTTNEEIHLVNKEFRGIDRPTDVLSFPSVDFQVPCDYDHIEEMGDYYFDPESGELILGSILISKDKVIEQSKEYGHSVEREYAFLIAHSMLHLLGYDHMEEEERAVMEAKQRTALEELGIKR